jgi:Ca2+-transporting ATPase
MLAESKGLTTSEAKKRLEQYGENTLPEKPQPTSFAIYISQLKNPLVYILLAAAFVTFFLSDFSDTAIILFVVLVNSTLGFIQEKRANNALSSLKELIHPTADVIRNGKKVKVDVELIVPGDVVELELGEKVPADGKLLSANRLFIEEAILTGESIPVEKKEGDEAYMGTIVSSGEALMEVGVTGAETQIGKIAALP